MRGRSPPRRSPELPRNGKEGENRSLAENRAVYSMGEGGRGRVDAKRDTAGYRESSEEAREQPVDFYFNSRRDLSFEKLRRTMERGGWVANGMRTILFTHTHTHTHTRNLRAFTAEESRLRIE